MTLKLLLEAAFSAFAETSSLAIADSRQTFNWSDPLRPGEAKSNSERTNIGGL